MSLPLAPQPWPEAVVFDLDGTLIDSVGDIARVLNRFLAGRGRAALAEATVRQLIGDGALNLIRQAYAATGAELEPAAERPALADFLALYQDHDSDPDCPYPGVVETLAALGRRGIRLGLCTNKPEAVTRKVLAQIGLADRFTAIAGGDTLPVRKPDGRHLAWVIEALDSTPAATVMVGDNANDVAAARQAGARVVAVSYGYPRMPIAALGADLVIDRFADLPAALARLAG